MEKIKNYFKLKELNKYLRRNYTLDVKDDELIIKNVIYAYELLKIRKWLCQGNIKVKNIRVEG